MSDENEKRSETQEVSDFEKTGISKEWCNALLNINIEKPTSVQSSVIPLLLAGKNVLFKSETGTGKTFAYLLPMVQRIASEEKTGGVKAVILSPTYELSSQIKAQLQKISAMKSALLIGGAPIKRQIESLREKPAIVIGSVGRITELLRLKKLKGDNLEWVVLDECDRLLDRELREDTQTLLSLLCEKKKVQVAGCSATADKRTAELVSKMTGAELDFEELPSEHILREKIEHWALFAERRDKIDTLRSFINAVNAKASAKIIVFTARPDQVENIERKLSYKKIKCVALHAKMGKMARKSAVDSFRNGKNPVLITSDVSARGLDIPCITHVVQLDLGDDAAFFTHRAGRTARQGAHGVNVVIGDEREMRSYAALEKKLGIVVYPKMLFKGEVVAPK